MLEAVCAFANEPDLGEGYLLLGVVASSQIELFSHSFEVVGIEDLDRVQSELATRCRTAFNRPIRPQVVAEEMEGHTVVVVRVQEVAPGDKPIYLNNLGLPRRCDGLSATSGVSGALLRRKTRDDIQHESGAPSGTGHAPGQTATI